MNLQTELNRIAAKYGIESQENFSIEIKNVVSLVVDDLVKIGKERKGMDGVIKIVAQEFNISFEDMFISTRKHKLLFPRQMAMYFLWEQKYNLQTIAERFGYKDHTTAMNSRDKIKNYINQGYFVNEFMNIKDKLSSHIFTDNGQPDTSYCE